MLTIDIVTLLPELLESPLQHSILKRAQDKGLIKLNIHQLRDYASGKHKQADDTAYGGGAGMVMMIEPIAKCIDTLKEKTEYDEIIYLSPDGEQLDQNMANQLSLKQNLLILCGHYKGIDERVRELYITKEISIGDYVLSGGELPAVVVIDTVARLIPGVLNNESSALSDSFQDNLIAPPVYTRPAEFRGMKVPDVLLSGHEAKINEWRDEQSEKRTKERRPDMDR